jgi:hypothetical protein
MQAGTLRSLVPRPIRRPLGNLLHTCEAPFYYRRAKQILSDYTDHYRQAQRVFREEGNVARLAIDSLTELGVRVISPGASDNLIDLRGNYLSLVERVSECAGQYLSATSHCSFFPALPTGSVDERTEDVPAIRDGAVIAMQLKDPLALEGLEDLCGPVIREIEQKIYASYALLDKVYVYRNPVSRQALQGSWLWHYDNHPYEILKIMIYLTDVSDQSAPFEYLRHPDSMKAVPGSRLTPLYGESRVTKEDMERYFGEGFVPQQVTGPKGTMIVFDNNMIHRSNLAVQTHRDVLILQVRPAAGKYRPYVDARWTGSFQHAPFNRNPGYIKTTTRRLRHFS